MLRVLLYLVPVVMAVYAVVDCVQTEDERVRGLPKLAWVFVILLFPVAGSIVWFVAGRERGITLPGLPGPQRGQRGQGGFGPRRPGPPRGPDDDPDFLKGL